MSNVRTLFFHAFLDALSNIVVESQAQLQRFQGEFASAISGLNPIAAGQYAEQQLSKLSPDSDLLALFDGIRSFQEAALGEGFVLEDDHQLVIDTYQTAGRLSGKQEVPLSFATQLAEHLRTALSEWSFIAYLTHLIQQNDAAVSEYRIGKLEEAIAHQPSAVEHAAIGAPSLFPDNVSSHEFTLTRQALAIHYLVYDALGVTGIDTTKVIALAHLLSAKKIPQKNGKDNLDNSGIKTAFRNMWLKEDKNHLADLRFVLRFLKPLETDSDNGIGRAIKTIERRIQKVSEKLIRDND